MLAAEAGEIFHHRFTGVLETIGAVRVIDLKHRAGRIVSRGAGGEADAALAVGDEVARGHQRDLPGERARRNDHGGRRRSCGGGILGRQRHRHGRCARGGQGDLRGNRARGCVFHHRRGC